MKLDLTELDNRKLEEYKFEVISRVSHYDGVDDDLYNVWRTLLELIWIEEKRRLYETHN